MKNKYLVLFACLLVGLIVIYVAQKRSAKIDVVKSGIEQLLPGRNLDKVSEIRVYRSGQQPGLVLKRSDKAWTIPDYFDAPANSQKIESFLQDIEHLRGEKRASSKDVFSAFGVEDDKALILEFLSKDGEPLFVILAGKQGPMGNGSFIRFKDQADVYLAEKNLLASFGIFGDERKAPEPKLWADLKVLQNPTDSWASVELSQPGASYSFVKQNKQAEAKSDEQAPGEASQPPAPEIWLQQKPDNPKLEEGKIQSSLNALANLQASQLADPARADAFGLKAPAYRAKITLKDGKTVQLLVNQPEGKGPVYAGLDNKKEIYQFTEGSLQTIFKNLTPQPEPTDKSAEQKSSK
jgi:hypothetical protein